MFFWITRKCYANEKDRKRAIEETSEIKKNILNSYKGNWNETMCKVLLNRRNVEAKKNHTQNTHTQKWRVKIFVIFFFARLARCIVWYICCCFAVFSMRQHVLWHFTHMKNHFSLLERLFFSHSSPVHYLTLTTLTINIGSVSFFFGVVVVVIARRLQAHCSNFHTQTMAFWITPNWIERPQAWQQGTITL